MLSHTGPDQGSASCIAKVVSKIIPNIVSYVNTISSHLEDYSYYRIQKLCALQGQIHYHLRF